MDAIIKTKARTRKERERKLFPGNGTVSVPRSLSHSNLLHSRGNNFAVHVRAPLRSGVACAHSVDDDGRICICTSSYLGGVVRSTGL